MFEFSEQVKELLRKADWYEGRNVNIGSFRIALEADGYLLSEKIETFLKEFGYLNIDYPGKTDDVCHFHFDARISTEEVDPLWAQEDYSKRLNNEGLCVIGQAHSDHMTLMMNSDGEVYGGFDEFLCFIAGSGKEAIEAICLNKEVVEIP